MSINQVAIATDGMGSLSAVDWDFFNVLMEPGIPYMPFAGLTADEVADALNEELLSQPSQSPRP